MEEIGLKKKLQVLLAAFILCPHFWHSFDVFATEGSEEVKIIKEEGFSADGHHADHHITANFIPENILNPNGSPYEAPENIQDYVGTYVSETEIPVLNTTLHLIVSIEEDGLFNLAYYFNNKPGDKGSRFFVNKHNEIETSEAVYQDLVILTGALIEGENGLTSGLIRKTISPVVLLDQDGQVDKLYPYHAMAYDLRENYQNARVYQNVGLSVVKNELNVDINHLIGLSEGEEIDVSLNLIENTHTDQFLVKQRTYEILQESFDTYLDNYNDFKLEFESLNDFVQVIQAMHLKTNASFPKSTTFEIIDPEDILNKETNAKNVFALVINNELLYFYDGTKLFVSKEFSKTDQGYKVSQWKTN